MTDEMTPRQAPEHDEDQDYDAEDEELQNELAILEAERAGYVDENEEPEDDEDEPSREEQAELMRGSLEFAEDIRHLPDGTRFLPSYDQDHR